ncbi:MAG TPA: YsnF/AvaK domain-containing protein, partial [Herpetosiphonaceae bacterium]|nr:YsnF/AvaK domain-containing protein [Herpetosiphonaceae bacterium]
GTTDYTTTGGAGSGAAMGTGTSYGTSDRDMTTSGATSGAAMGSATDYGTSDRDMTTSGGFQSGTRDVGADQGEVSIPVVEEQIRVGTREVESGGVRVDTRVEETPVREQVNLRDEQVRVERRPVDQAVDASTVTDAFREGTFEVRERDQEAVVQKDARVVEEVVINKDVQERTETVEDTVRRTDVDVQEMSGDARGTGYTGTSGTTGGYTDASTTMGGNERRTGLDVDNSGEAGDRDRRNNF